MRNQYTLKEYLILLSECRFLRIEEKWYLLKEAFPDIIIKLDMDWLDRIRLRKEKWNQFRDYLYGLDLKQLMTSYKQGIRYISFFDFDYPSRLRHTYAPPLLLYYEGDKRLLKKESIAIVGSRNHTDYSQHALEALVPPLVERDLVIVSGLARGVDTLAHHLTINSSGSTIAVIANGTDIVYPYENTRLQNIISKHHLLISEYPPGQKAHKTHFPMRNRIIAGISRATLVTEAKERSGSLITARIAVEEGRDVFALPGPIHQVHSEGTNQLILQGATPLIQANQIIEEWSL